MQSRKACSLGTLTQAFEAMLLSTGEEGILDIAGGAEWNLKGKGAKGYQLFIF